MSTDPQRRPVLLVVAVLALGARPPDLAAQEAFHSRCGAGVHESDRSGWIWLPQGEIFCPLAADPKENRSFVMYLRGDFATIASPDPEAKTNIGAVGLGDALPIFRVGTAGSEDGVQLDLAGAVFSQFNLDERSLDLVNADYVVGLPLTLRMGGFTTRLRIYHQSSHLGDEFILNRDPERINLSFESIELIVSHEIGPLRLYAGGEDFFRSEPADLPTRLAHVGAELRPAAVGDGRLLAAVDLKLVDDVEWARALNARVGVEIARTSRTGHPPRVLSLIAELYDGAAPYGQFYREDIRYFGIGFNLSS